MIQKHECLVAYNRVGHKQVLYNYAIELGYQYFIWNDVVYSVDAPQERIMTVDQLNQNEVLGDLLSM